MEGLETDPDNTIAKGQGLVEAMAGKVSTLVLMIIMVAVPLCRHDDDDDMTITAAGINF